MDKLPIKVKYNKIQNIGHDTINAHTYIFTGYVPKHVQTAIKKWNVPILKEYYGNDVKVKLGGDDDFILTDMDLNKVSTQVNTVAKDNVTYVFDISLQYNNLMELKEKISVAANIPVACQHLCWGHQQTTYEILVNQGLQQVDIETIVNAKTFADLIDGDLYSNKDGIEVNALDTFILVSQNAYVVYDLRDFMPLLRGDRSVVYWGFIVKYWPMFTFEAFNAFVSTPTQIADMFPLLFPNNEDLMLKFAAEYNSRPHDSNINLQTTIQSAYLSVTGIEPINNLRNTFDALTCSKDLPEIHLHMQYKENKYLVKKYKDTTVQFPMQHNDCIIAVLPISSPTKKDKVLTNDTRPIFVTINNDGSYVVGIKWGDNANVEFGDVLDIVKAPVNAFISYVNNASGNQLTKLNERTFTFQNVDVGIKWRLVMNERAFRAFITSLISLQDASVMYKKEVVSDNVYIFRKGMHRFKNEKLNMSVLSSIGISLSNQYQYLTNSSVLARWRQLYDGKTLVITHRTADIRFNVYGIYEDEYEIIRTYLSSAIASYMKTVDKGELRQKASVHKLKKMQEEDPVLFSLGSSGSVKDLYSRVCQKPRQPVSYNEAEYKSLGRPKSAKQYWNFTTNTPMYYECPTSVYPILGWVGYDRHPQSLCMPCCNKITTTSSEKRDAIETACLTNHRYERGVLSTRHMVKYGKSLQTGKSSYINPQVAKVLQTDELHLVGQPSLGIREFEIAGAICGALSIPISSYFDAINEYMTPQTVAYLQGGSLPATIRETIRAMYERKLYHTYNVTWIELFVELTLHIYGVRIFIINGDAELYTEEPIYRTKQNIIITMVGKAFYPMFLKNNSIFEDETFIQILYDICSVNERGLTYDTLHSFCQRAGYSIVGRAVNRSGNTYGSIITTPSGNMYIGVNYSRAIGSDVIDPLKYISILATVQATVVVLQQLNITPTQLLQVDGVPCAIVDNAGIVHYVNGGDYDLPKKDIMYHPLQVNAVIVSRVSDNIGGRMAEVGTMMYQTYQYRLFVSEFFKYTNTTRNEPIREAILKIVNSKDRLASRLNKLFADELANSAATYEPDRIRLQGALRAIIAETTTITKFTKWFNDNRFNFDDLIVNQILKVSREEAQRILAEHVSLFTVQSPLPEHFTFPNIYVPCAHSAEPYCYNRKLIIQDLSKMIELLVDDIKNSVKLRYLRAVRNDTIINYLEFKPRDDIIEIYNLGLS